MGILWVSASDVWLRIFSIFLLGEAVHVIVSPVISPVIMVETTESRIWMGVLWVSSSNVWLRIFSNLT